MTNSGYTGAGNAKSNTCNVSLVIEDGQVKASNGTSLGWSWMDSLTSRATYGTISLTEIAVSEDG